MVPDNFMTPIIRSIAKANLVIIFPTLSAFLPRSPFVKKPIAAATPNSPTAIAATPPSPCSISSWFIPPTILAATATMRIAAAICARLIFSPFTLPPKPFSVFPNSKEVSDSLDTAITKPANITLKAKITPTACRNLVGSNIVITATAPTRIKIATAKFFIPSVLCSNPIPLNILPRPFVILEKLFINLGSLSLNVETVSAALLRISPNPPNGSVKFSKIFRTFLPNIAAVTLVIIANILSHCIFPFSSDKKSNIPWNILTSSSPRGPAISFMLAKRSDPRPLRASNADGNNDFNPLIKPNITNAPIAKALTEGECTPKASINAEIKFEQKLIILSITPEIPSPPLLPIPFLNPSITSLPICIAMSGMDFNAFAIPVPSFDASSSNEISPFVKFVNASFMFCIASKND